MFEELKALHHSKATEQLILFWMSLPRDAGQLCPNRSGFSSAKVAPMLPEMFMSEWRTNDALVIIQAGTMLDRVIGQDITGKSIFDVIPAALVPSERLYYQQLRDTPCAGMVSRLTYNLGQRPLIYRTIQLPLLDREGTVRYFVGTGYEVPLDDAEASAWASGHGTTRHQEKRFFDIGAGVPSSQPA